MKRRSLILLAVLTSGCLFSGGDAPISVGDTVDDGMSSDTPDMSVVSKDGGEEPPDMRRPPDMTVVETCGDGLLQPEETCDPMLPDTSPAACPASCDDGIACTEDALVGSAETCDAACASTAVEACVAGDGCCPEGCNPTNDVDCDDTVVCGDGVVSGPELCDPMIAVGAPGACPEEASCTPLACNRPIVVGSASNCDAQCAYVPVTACANDDGCCAVGCDIVNDNDCAIVCGNGTVEQGELCDGNCPAVADCNDMDACTTDTLTGSAGTCDADCQSATIDACVSGDGCCPPQCDNASDDDCSATCGNNVIDSGETCDPPGSCPASCDDADVCTSDQATGSPANCNVNCTNTQITSCAQDGCCAPGCNANNDVDCAAMCGNGVVEGAEKCDGNCPPSCDDMNACTTDTSVGSAANCDLECNYTNVTSCIDSDGCCPGSCNSLNDNDCGVVCGNGIVESGESCDTNCPVSCNDGDSCTNDIPTGSAASCTKQCSYSTVTACISNDGCCPSACTSANDSDCSASCGNNVVEAGETCDGNCPTQNDCTSQGPCRTLNGNAAQCTAECGDINGCVACDRNGNCPCAAGEECNNGVCEQSDGNGCTNACDAGAFCVVHGDVGWQCDQNDDICKECLVTSHCNPLQMCDGIMCVQATSCSEAKAPNAWCVAYTLDSTCDAGTGACYTPCNSASECPFPSDACVGGSCETATICTDAKNPGLWCENVNQGGDTCVFGICFDGCPTGDACECPFGDAACAQAPSGDYYCDLPISCLEVCPINANAWCVAQHGTGSICTTNTGPKVNVDGCYVGD